MGEVHGARNLIKVHFWSCQTNRGTSWAYLGGTSRTSKVSYVLEALLGNASPTTPHALEKSLSGAWGPKGGCSCNPDQHAQYTRQNDCHGARLSGLRGELNAKPGS